MWFGPRHLNSDFFFFAFEMLSSIFEAETERNYLAVALLGCNN